MLVVHVHVHVKPDSIDDFRTATLDNARQSLNEPGVARFDVIQDQTERTHFVLVEVYKTEGAPGAHKETAHYKTWRDRVESMMAQPRSSQKYDSLYPEADRWQTPG